ncbi:MAG TPA: hypothetical protein VFG59_19940 [Anaeromyxobacter sp.]|nr:hypothetical protein [Anaeromyxobacter sp.]
MTLHAAVAAVLVAFAPPARGGDGACTVEVGPGERFTQGRDAVVQPGEHLQHVTALRGRVVIRGGAEVDEAMALGGDLVLEPGARVNGSVNSVGGNVFIQGNAWVSGDAVSLGGEVQRSKESWVGGNVIALAVKVGDQTLARAISERLGDLARCTVVQVRAHPAAAAGDDGGKTL